jgi:NIPSNAP
MYVEERIYTVMPGRIAEYFSLYEAKGMIPQQRYIKHMLGYYASEVGDLNEVIHMWVHESLDARERNREAMKADREFAAYWHEVRGIVVAQRTRIMKPAPFFSDRLGQLLAICQPNLEATTHRNTT